MFRPSPLACALVLALIATAPSSTADAARKKGRKDKPAATSPACVDFYSHANAEWLKTHAGTSAIATVSAMGQLRQRARQQQGELLDAAMAAPRNGTQTLLGDFWASGLDEAAIERDGARALAPLLERIDAIRKASDVAPAIAALHQHGIPVVFGFGADIAPHDPARHVGYFTQGGLGLPDPAFYTRGDAETRRVLGQYNGYVQKILALTGTPAARVPAEAQQVIDLETRIARASRPLAAPNDPEGRYAPAPVAGLDKAYRKLRLADFLETQGVTDASVSIADPQLFTQLDQLVGSVKPAHWKTYLRWRAGDAMAPYLSRAWRDASFDFRGRVLAGETTPPSRREAVLDAINRVAGPMLAREYVARYLPPATRSRAAEIATQVREALDASVDADPRFGAQARAEAHAKLAALRIEIGEPGHDLDYTLPPMERGSFAGNALIASGWRHREEMRRIGRRNAVRRWDVLPQQPALAYDLARNRLIVTAAVLQPPVLDPSAGAAMQYGSFGALVGRELHHAIDSKGRLIDAKGAWRDWWTPTETAARDALVRRVSVQYGAYAGPSGGKIDGSRVSEVALADQAGVELAWRAFNEAQPGAGKRARQDFFMAWARLWPQQLGQDAAFRWATGNLYPPAQWRANGPLVNHPGFGDAFGCKPATPMQAPSAQRISLWPAPAPAAAPEK